jgi:AmmeMemoRadiSam system protein B
MDSPAFEQHLHRLRSEFAEMSVRLSSHKGAAYPDDRNALLQQLDGYFTDVNGPGSVPEATHRPSASSLKAIMAPHIDISTGGPTFAWAYHALATSDADRFVILGTSHVEMKNFFALTRKTFETPFGHVETDQVFVDALAGQLSYDPFEDELIHKSEHSIEFQVVFLQYLREKMGRGSVPIKIVPILCGGSMHEAIVSNQPMDQVPQLDESIKSLHAVFEQYPGTCLVASVDFSHIGLRYGDPEEPSPQKLTMVEETDRTLLAALERVDHQDFVAQLQQNCNATQVCGFVPIYTMLRLLEGTRGTLLHYDRTELNPGSFVSFASMAWSA